MNALLMLAFITCAGRAQDVPGYPRSTQANQDLGYANENFSDLASRDRNKACATPVPQFCPAGSTLTGAYYNKSGATCGGTCTTVPAAATGINFIRIASGTFSGVNASTFTISPAANDIYWIRIVSTASATQDLYISLNGEGNGTTNHIWVMREDNTAANNGNSSTGDQGIPLDYTPNHIQATAVLKSWGYIFFNSDSSTEFDFNSKITNPVSNVKFSHAYPGGWYNKTSSITSISLRATAGNISGFWDILKL